jgi:vacuole morphology and inheritance protein 14
MIPFTPRLIPCILPNLAHHVPMIQSVAVKTNKLLFDVIKSLPSPADQVQKAASIVTTTTTTSTRAEKIGTPPPTSRLPHSPMATNSTTGLTNAQSAPVLNNSTRSGASPDPAAQLASGTRPPSPVESTGTSGQPQTQEEADPFDYVLTVNELTIQFLSEWEETRVTTLKWLIMLHQKAPRKVKQPQIIDFDAELSLIDPVYG